MVALPPAPGRPPAARDGGGAGSSLTLGAAAKAVAPGISSLASGSTAPEAPSGPSRPDAPAASGAAPAAPVPAAVWQVISAISIEHLAAVGADTIPLRVRAAEEVERRAMNLVEPTEADIAMVIAAVMLELAIEHQIAAIDGGAA